MVMTKTTAKKDFEMQLAGDRVLFGYDEKDEPFPWYWECVGDPADAHARCSGRQDTGYGYKTRDDAIAGAKRNHPEANAA